MSYREKGKKAVVLLYLDGKWERQKERNGQDYTAVISNLLNRQRSLLLSYYMSAPGQQGGLFCVTRITLTEKPELKDHSRESGTSSEKLQPKNDIYHFGL